MHPHGDAVELWLGVRGAAAVGPINARVLREAGGSFAHAPLNASVAAIYCFEGEAKAAVGVEVIADWARTYPFLVAPEAQVLTHVFGKPLRGTPTRRRWSRPTGRRPSWS